MTKVYVDPACNVNYCSFYIQGLYDFFGKKNVIFTTKYFRDLRYAHDSHCLAFVINNKRYVVDSSDSNQLYHECFLQWADVYGKVNYYKDYIPIEWQFKIIKIAPNFGIANFGNNKWVAMLYATINYFRTRNRQPYGFKVFKVSYLWLYKRANEKWQPEQSVVGSNKITIIGRYWANQPWVNEARIAFIRACKRLESEGLIEFIGGLVPDRVEHDCPRDVLLEQEIPFDQYTKYLSESLIAFNTPAYHKCHGWKLSEFMAKGKIILSTPFVNELPTPMQHEENIYFSQADEQSLYESIKHILENKTLQRTLEVGSRKYWEQYGSPKMSIKYFLEGSKLL